MACPSCALFEGNPCRLCRTHKRIRELLCGGLLLRGQEEAALQILRAAAGALLDLAEEAAPVLARERRESNPVGFAADASLEPTLTPIDPTGERVRPHPGVASVEPGGGIAPARVVVKDEQAEDSKKEPLAEVKVDEKDEVINEVAIAASASPGEEKGPEGEEAVKKKKKRKRKTTQEGNRTEKRRRRRRDGSQHPPIERDPEPPTRTPPLAPGPLSPTIHLLAKEAEQRVTDPGQEGTARHGGRGAKAKAAVKARAKAAIHRAARRGALRRPAGAPAAVVAPGVIDRWRAGEEVALSEITLEELGRGVKIALTKGSYFLAEGQVAGTLDSMTVEAGEVHLALTPTGTTNENLLKHCTGNPGKLIRCHRCTPLCAGEREKTISETFGHAQKLEESQRPPRKIERSKAARWQHRKGGEKKTKGSGAARAHETTSGSSSSAKVDGRHARGAATKPLAALFAGTGLDPKERVRKRVIRRARKEQWFLKEDTAAEEISDLSLFDPETRLQRVAELYPGVLTAQALKGMRFRWGTTANSYNAEQLDRCMELITICVRYLSSLQDGRKGKSKGKEREGAEIQKGTWEQVPIEELDGEVDSSWDRELEAAMNGDTLSSCGRELGMMVDGAICNSWVREVEATGHGSALGSCGREQAMMVSRGREDGMMVEGAGCHSWERELEGTVHGMALGSCGRERGMMEEGSDGYPTPRDETFTSSVAKEYSFPPAPPLFEGVEGLQQPTADHEPSAEKDFLRECDEGLKIAGLGSKVLQQLMGVFPLRSSTTGKGKADIFPLPTSIVFLKGLWDGVDEDVVSWGRLVRLPLRKAAPLVGSAYHLAFKLGNLISLKGEDILLSTPTTQLARLDYRQGKRDGAC
ncbi:unnamed protein product [Durusdinium trenchii]|uniref:Uncharacterized protein n=1 Tax=Durusdinium trenchii TaxID=1381693 RepID=A0ABP0JHK5_9DINO